METNELKKVENILIDHAVKALEQANGFCKFNEDCIDKTIIFLNNKLQDNELYSELIRKSDILNHRIDYNHFNQYSFRIMDTFMDQSILSYYDLLKVMLLNPNSLLRMRNIGIRLLESIALHLKDLGIIDNYTVDGKKLYVTSSQYEKYIRR